MDTSVPHTKACAFAATGSNGSTRLHTGHFCVTMRELEARREVRLRWPTHPFDMTLCAHGACAGTPRGNFGCSVASCAFGARVCGRALALPTARRAISQARAASHAAHAHTQLCGRVRGACSMREQFCVCPCKMADSWFHEVLPPERGDQRGGNDESKARSCHRTHRGQSQTLKSITARQRPPGGAWTPTVGHKNKNKRQNTEHNSG